MPVTWLPVLQSTSEIAHGSTAVVPRIHEIFNVCIMLYEIENNLLNITILLHVMDAPLFAFKKKLHSGWTH